MEVIHPSGRVNDNVVTADMCTPNSLDPQIPPQFAVSSGEKIEIDRDFLGDVDDSEAMEASSCESEVPQDSEWMRYPEEMSYQQGVEYGSDSDHPQATDVSPINATFPEYASQQPMAPPPEQQDLGHLPVAPPQGELQQGDNNAGAPFDTVQVFTIVHDWPITALVYSADGKYVASGSEDATVIIWDALSKAVLHRMSRSDETGHTATVTPLAFSRDNIYLASASDDEKLIIIWAVASGRVHKRITPEGAIHSLAYTPDRKYLIAGVRDGTLLLWDANTYELAGTLTKSTELVTFIIFSPDGSLMATGGTESVCHIWKTADIAGGEPLSVLTGHRGIVCAAAFSNDNRRIITASEDRSSRIWNALTGELLVTLYVHTGPVRTVAFSPDGKRVASGSSDSTVKVCHPYTSKPQLSLKGHEESMINAVAFSPDGKYIASAASDNTVRLWNAVDGTNQTTFNEHNDNVTMVMFAPDGSTLASGSYDGTVRIRLLRAQD